MILNFNDIFWGDSTLEKIEIEYNKIVVLIFNDATDQLVKIECEQCIGMTDIIIWDEVIIDNVFLKKFDNQSNPLVKRICDIYKNTQSVKIELNSGLYELRIVLIEDIEFSIICKKITIKTIDE